LLNSHHEDSLSKYNAKYIYIIKEALRTVKSNKEGDIKRETKNAAAKSVQKPAYTLYEDLALRKSLIKVQYKYLPFLSIK
jgi:hypothetical protein